MISAREIVVDLFAGGGGASTGIRSALGRAPDIAINHSAAAIAMHTRNHPSTRHYREDVWDVEPRIAVGRRKVGLLWASPDCTHFSRAKGGVPKSKKIRSLAQVVIKWAAAVRPRVIVVENVPEFETWGPLGDDSHPIKARAGETFRAWIADLELQGYHVERRTLTACDYGTPTSRKRLFIVARCDGAPIIWPEPTHGPGRAHPWRTAAEIIDWSLPVPSIFGRSKPLADKTLTRIARGLERFVFDAAEPFVVPGCGFAPTLVQTGYGERPGQDPRVLDLHKPLTTVVATGQKHALVAAFLSKHYTGVTGQPLERSIGTVTAVDHHALSVAWLAKYYGNGYGADVRTPLPTVTAGGGGHLAEVRAFLIKYYGTATAADLAEPLDTVTARARFGLVMVRGELYEIADIGMRMLQPHELFAAQGFPSGYDLMAADLTKTEQIRLVGNSVCPPVASALVRAQFAPAQRMAA